MSPRMAAVDMTGVRRAALVLNGDIEPMSTSDTLVAPVEAPDRPETAKLPIWAWAMALLPAVVVLCGGWVHRWVAEDGYIDFRVIHNIWAGYGPVFNPGQRIEVYTDPLWVATLTVVGGALRFIALGWIAVVLGLAGTVAGFLLGARAAQNLAAHLGRRPAVPVGLLVASAVDGVWDFATSGPETGFIFAWEGITWWLLVRCAVQRKGLRLTAFVVGLGVLIRPDLALFSMTFYAALVFIVRRQIAHQQDGPVGRAVLRRCAGLFGIMVAVPVLYEIWRMAYFSMLLPNTAIAKSAGTTWWSQGYTYFRDFYTADYLFLPALALAGLVAYQMAGYVQDRDWLPVVVVAAPLLAGVLDCLYVVRVGGDFMHARFLLPSFFALALVAWTPLPRHGQLSSMLVVALCGYAAIAAAHLRYSNQGSIQANGITSERMFWIGASQNEHPITLYDYRKEFTVGQGHLLARQAAHTPPGTYVVDVTSSQFSLGNHNIRVPARFPLGPERVVVDEQNIGLLGVAAGPHVYDYDSLSLANPIGSHTQVLKRGRPGHEKVIGPSWMLAQFVPPQISTAYKHTSAHDYSWQLIWPTPQRVTAARQDLNGSVLNSYLAAIDRPLTLHRIISNILGSVGHTFLSFSANPVLARSQLHP